MPELRAPLLQPIRDSFFSEYRINVSVLRLDVLHPVVSGNKLYKLKYNLETFLNSGKDCLVTFGGAYSNHIAATAVACHEKGIPCIGIIRGEELNENSNSRLRLAAACGMKLIFIKRDLFRRLLAAPEQIEGQLMKLAPG